MCYAIMQFGITAVRRQLSSQFSCNAQTHALHTNFEHFIMPTCSQLYCYLREYEKQTTFQTEIRLLLCRLSTSILSLSVSPLAQLS